ncbi:hypothetical protein MHU86_23385 [Fragilaria crotonensis]|nr:hypothetical protein MHU86_23385 [Fragilaria crotonensis]
MPTEQLYTEKTLTSSTTTLTGVWEVDASRSDSLASLLVASGAPAMFAPVIGRILDKDVLHFHLDDEVVSLKYQRRISLPFKLQTDISYKVGEAVNISTPVGVQEGHIVSSNETSCKMIRYGPKEGEKVEDTFESHQDGRLIYSLLHTSPNGKQTRARRVFSRVFPAPR